MLNNSKSSVEGHFMTYENLVHQKSWQMSNYHRERFGKLHFRALALHQSEWRRAKARNVSTTGSYESRNVEVEEKEIVEIR